MELYAKLFCRELCSKRKDRTLVFMTNSKMDAGHPSCSWYYDGCETFTPGTPKTNPSKGVTLEVLRDMGYVGWYLEKWELDEYRNKRNKHKETDMSKEDLVYDLCHLEPNFESVGHSTGNRIVIKIGNTTQAFDENGKHVWQGLDDKVNCYHRPLPTATPQPKRVKLKNSDGREVWCDFVATHSFMGDKCRMILKDSNTRAKHVVISNDEDIADIYSVSSGYSDNTFTPIHPPKPTHPIMAKIAQIKRDHSPCSAAAQDIVDLEQLVKKEYGL